MIFNNGRDWGFTYSLFHVLFDSSRRCLLRFVEVTIPKLILKLNNDIRFHDITSKKCESRPVVVAKIDSTQPIRS